MKSYKLFLLFSLFVLTFALKETFKDVLEELESIRGYAYIQDFIDKENISKNDYSDFKEGVHSFLRVDKLFKKLCTNDCNDSSLININAFYIRQGYSLEIQQMFVSGDLLREDLSEEKLIVAKTKKLKSETFFEPQKDLTNYFEDGYYTINLIVIKTEKHKIIKAAEILKKSILNSFNKIKDYHKDKKEEKDCLEEFSVLEKVLQDVKEEDLKLKSEIEKQNSEKQMLTNNIEILKQSNTEIFNLKVASIKDDISKGQETYENNKRKLESVQLEIKNLDFQRNNLKEEILKAESKISSKKLKEKELRNFIEENTKNEVKISEEINAQKKNLENLEKEDQLNKEELNNKLAAVKKLNEEIRILTDKGTNENLIKEITNNIGNLTEQKNKITKETLIPSRKQIESLESEISNDESNKKEKKAQKAKINKELLPIQQNLKERLEFLISKFESLKRSLDTVKDSLDSHKDHKQNSKKILETESSLLKLNLSLEESLLKQQKVIERLKMATSSKEKKEKDCSSIKFKALESESNYKKANLEISSNFENLSSVYHLTLDLFGDIKDSLDNERLIPAYNSYEDFEIYIKQTFKKRVKNIDSQYKKPKEALKVSQNNKQSSSTNQFSIYQSAKDLAKKGVGLIYASPLLNPNNFNYANRLKGGRRKRIR